MSTQANIEKRTDSPSLIGYLKEEIPMEDLRDAYSPERINSIDFVKGLAMVFIILAHTSAAWFNVNWIYIHGMVYAALDIMGPSLFVFLSALSVIFSIKRKKGDLPEKVIRSRIYSRGFVIMGIGILYNFMAFNTGLVQTDYYFPFTLWGWNILTFIGFSQIVSYHAMKLEKQTRAVLGLFIIFISSGIRDFIYAGKDTNLVLRFFHYIITSPAPQVTLFPWLAVCFISTIFGEYLYEAMMDGPGPAYVGLVRLFLIWGTLMVLTGVFLPLPQPDWVPGFALATPKELPIEEYGQMNLLSIINSNKFGVRFPGLPYFLVRGTPSAMIYQLGAALLIIGICFYLIDIKNIDNGFTKMLIYYGKVSLSLFLLHYTFVPVYFGAYSIVIFPFVVLGYVGFFGFMMFIWFKYFDGKYSPEWIMIQMGRVGQKTGEEVKKGGKKIAERAKETVEKLKGGKGEEG